LHRTSCYSHEVYLWCLMKKALPYMAGAFLLCAAVPRTASTHSSRSSEQQDTERKTKTFSGTIIKDGDNFVLRDAASKLSYVLDDAEKAGKFEGKNVKVTGTLDVARNTIHVAVIQEIA